MCISEKELNVYKSLNKIASRNSVVLLGSTYAKEIPVSELKQTYGILSDLYNRSLTDLSVFEANDIVIDTINCLKPKKILLQLGESDVALLGSASADLGDVFLGGSVAAILVFDGEVHIPAFVEVVAVVVATVNFLVVPSFDGNDVVLSLGHAAEGHNCCQY